MTLFDRLRAFLGGSQAHTPSDSYREAIEISDDLIEKFRQDESSRNIPSAVMAAIWMHRHNVPYLTTVYEATQEMNAAAGGPDDV